ncbi:hypothetical protein CAPTEDRAFT_225906 [Capitella teleta]|uniref:Uncharacterized protein n=1 Tax=Capitella teleta TaxID=283909 RepID=R7TLU0_CAPTE|nr:hypothetical protein CAPTEDRAFT_225906 [Capitella teleta]|eukprot:ELT94482.1 hypothetical protein CAPTEDRAFT_225906 [Capitella teleta]
MSPMSSALIVLAMCSIFGELNADTMQCYECSFIEIESDNAVLGFLFDIISAISDEHCKLAKESDIYEVNLRNCPLPEADEVTKCVNIKGEVNTQIEIIRTSFDLRYKTVNRDCVNVPKGDSESSDGCHDRLSNKGVKDMATSFLTGYAIADEVDWSGSVCYGGKFYSETGSGSRLGGASVVVLASLGFIAPRLF